MNIRTPLSQDEFNRLLKQIQPIKSGFDLLHDHVIITDANAVILYANNATVRSTGFPLAEVIGKNPADLWGGQMGKDFYENMWHTIKDEKRPFVGEVRNKRRDGTFYWQEMHVSPILDERGDVRFFIGIEPSITDRKEKEKFRDEFVSMLGHQLQNPLSAIKWALDFFLKDTNFTQEQRERIARVNEANESMIGLVADLLALSKIGGNAQIAREQLDLSEEIESIMRNVQEQSPGVSISFRKDDERFPLTANKPFLSQVFMNLVTNAAEYSDKVRGEVLLTLKKDNEGFLFSVENNGLTIPVEDQPKIFSKLFRASNAKQAKEGGSGLGLFLVKMICERFGWNVWFESPRPQGNGAIFFVKIPKN